MRKKLLSLALIMAMLVSMAVFSLPAAAADSTVGTVTVTPDTNTVPAGGTVTYTVALEGPVTAVEAVGFKLTVPAGLTYAEEDFTAFKTTYNAYEADYWEATGQFLALGFGYGTGAATAHAISVPDGQKLTLGTITFAASATVQTGAMGVADTVGQNSFNSYYMVDQTMTRVPVMLMSAVEPLGTTATLTNTTGVTTPAVIKVGGQVVTGSTALVPGAKFTVTCDNACVIAYSTDGGVTYQKLTATATAEANTYEFVAPDTNGVAYTIGVALKGDANGDGNIRANDVALIRRLISNQNGGTADVSAATALGKLAIDMTGEGVLRANDVALIRRLISSLNGGVYDLSGIKW